LPKDLIANILFAKRNTQPKVAEIDLGKVTQERE